MEDAGGQGGAGPPPGEHVHDVLHGARPAGSDDRDGEQAVQAGIQLAGVAGPGAVVVHGGEQDLPGAALLPLPGPVEEFPLRKARAAVGGAQPSAVHLFGVNRQHHELAAVLAGNLPDQLRTGEGGAVHRDFVGPGVQQPCGVVQRADSAPHREGNVNPQGDLLHQGGEGAPAFPGGADVQVHQFVGPVAGIADAHFHGVAHLAQALEVDPFHHLAVLDIQAGYYAFCDHKAMSLSVIRPS